jgi:pantoate--beta-alanine ligase
MIPEGFVVRTPEGLREITRKWRTEGHRTAIVPTMGALHQGHLALVQEAFRHAGRVVVSIFVNPKQFARGEDLSRYPRNEDRDSRMVAEAGAHLIYAPAAAIMYPADFATTISVSGPARAGLEDSFRPHFFDGVATVVAKLLIPAECDYAMFGEKDYQQLKVVTQLVRDLNMGTRIIPMPTVREADGLAMSSRNAYLTLEQRRIAPQLHAALLAAAKSIRAGMEPADAVADAASSLTRLGFDVDYVSARNADSLTLIRSRDEPIRLLAAARLGSTRLIDNVAV